MPSFPLTAIDVAKRFARSLDQADYASAAECLATACQYEIAGQMHVGPDAILASYRESGDWAARTLDGIRYENNVRPKEGGGVVVEFIDHLEHAGVTHLHRCEQHLRLDERGLISHIKHVDLLGEQEALDRFFAAVGLSRSTPGAEKA